MSASYIVKNTNIAQLFSYSPAVKMFSIINILHFNVNKIFFVVFGSLKLKIHNGIIINKVSRLRIISLIRYVIILFNLNFN